MSKKIISKILFFILFSSLSSLTLALDCDEAITQSELNKCEATSLEQETKKINRVYNDLRKKMDPKQQKMLKDIQLAWIKFRDLSCKYRASGAEGGSVHSAIVNGCLTEMTRQRIKELLELNNCAEGDLSCPNLSND